MTQDSAAGLHRLIYASRQALPAHADLGETVGDIIRTSIRNNREVAITGLLLVHDGWFVQALEGSPQAIAQTYGRIEGDQRHAETRVLIEGKAEAREFSDWNMCARTLSEADDALLDELEQRQTFAPSRLDGRAALRLLKAVRDIQGRGAYA